MNIPQRIHRKPYLERMEGEDLNHTAVRCANVIQYSLRELGFDHRGPVMIIDSDMFLTRDFSVRKYLAGYDLCGLPQSRPPDAEYLWNGLVMMDMRTLPRKKTLDFNCGRINGAAVDVGGHIHHYLKRNPGVRLRMIDHITFNRTELIALGCEVCRAASAVCVHNGEYLQSLGFDRLAVSFLQKGPSPVEFLAGNAFVHYRGGSNWDNQSGEFHRTKTALFREYLQEVRA